MDTIRVAIKLEPWQGTKLRKLAERCVTTPEQLASTIANLALSLYVGEPPSSPGFTAPQSERLTRNQPLPNTRLEEPANYSLPDTGFLRLAEIIGRPAKRGMLPSPRLVPVSRSTWLAGVKSGIYPQPVKLGGRVTAWRVEDIRAFIQDRGLM